MFGYVRICRHELNDDDFYKFNSYYCGLCKAIGRYSNTARLGLSYDMTFLAILLSAITDDKSEINTCRCILHPINKKHAVKHNKILDYAANIGILLSYKKLEDDWIDDKSLKSFAGMLLYKKAVGKAAKNYPKQNKKISFLISKISNLEKKIVRILMKLQIVLQKYVRKYFLPILLIVIKTKKFFHGWDITSDAGFI